MSNQSPPPPGRGEAPQPGWYDDPSGRFASRWWDGNRWTERAQGQDGAEHTDFEGADPEPSSNSSVWAIAIGVLVVLIAILAIILFVTVGDDDDDGGPASSPSTVPEESSTVPPSSETTTTTTTTEPTTTTESGDRQVTTFEGTGGSQSQSFTVANDWKLSWTVNGTDGITIEVYDQGANPNDVDPVQSFSASPGADEATVSTAGNYFLRIEPQGSEDVSWALTVLEPGG